MAARECRLRAPIGPPADVQDSQLRAADLIGQPLGRGKQLRTSEAADQAR
jgi:hypothetical protein